MKDLYDRIGLSPDARRGIIRRRIRKLNDEELERAAQEILLDSGRREVYDRNYHLLETIGELRARLKINAGAHWRQDKASRDFTVASKEVASQEEIWEARKGQWTWPGQAAPSSAKQGKASTSGVTPIQLLKRFGQLLLTIATRRAGLILFLGIIGLAVWTSGGNGNGDSHESSSDEPVNVSPNPGSGSDRDDDEQDTYPHDPKPLPENGARRYYTSDRQIAPLQISVSSEEHYYIKVVNAYTEERVLDLFIRSGQTARVKVPTGTYRLKYAVGEIWYGREHRFGPETGYFKADDTFTFEVVGQQVKGHTIELILQQEGNLPTESIPEGEF